MNPETAPPPVIARYADQKHVNLRNGDTVDVLIEGSQTGGRFSVTNYLSMPGECNVPLHMHPSYEEFWYITEGVLTLQMGDEIIHAEQGTAVSVPRLTPHTFWNDSGEPCRSVNVFSPAGFEQWFIRRVAMLEQGIATPETIAALATELDIVNLGPLSKKMFGPSSAADG
jgi:mannose-6-phosphate isomerase-like protein (cupin superfamily)